MKYTFLLLSTLLIAVSCKQESCSDDEQNQNETAVDCGGVCDVCPTCTDGIKNQDETDVDCGGVCGLCPIAYPQSGFFGANILYTPVDSFAVDTDYSMRAELPAGTSVKIKIALLTTIPGPSLWFYAMGSDENLMITPYNETTNEQYFQSISTGFIELNMTFHGGGTAKVEIFENNATTATFTKEITWY